MINPIRTATFSYAPPVIAALLAVWGLYRSTQVDESESVREFVLSIVLLGVAAVMGARVCLRERTCRERQLEDDVADLRDWVLTLDSELVSIRQDVDSRLAVQSWLEAFDRAEVHSGRPWITLAGKGDGDG